MSPVRRVVCFAKVIGMLANMAHEHDTTTESAYISEQLKQLAASLGLSQSALARMCGIDRRTFNPYYTGARPAGLPTIRKIAIATGRSMAWLLGEAVGRPVVGTADNFGRVTMTSPITAPSIVMFVGSVGPFKAGMPVQVDPASSFSPGEYMLVRTRETGDAWYAWGRLEGRLSVLDRLDGELHIYDPARYEVIGLVVGMVVKPPPPPSA
jgi:DNA-binding XRE family transcriptional regulator